MDSVFTFICENAYSAPWIIFTLLMLAGLNIPLSEDILLITGGAIASTCTPDNTLVLYLWVFFGCIFSAWEAYAIGRYIGPHLYDLKWFNYILTRERTTKLMITYEKYGIFTFFIVRFIPGGVRNALFMTSGLGKMPFLKFAYRDGLACLLACTTLFYIGYQFGTYYHSIIHYFKIYSYTSLVVIIILAALGFCFYLYRKKRTQPL